MVSNRAILHIAIAASLLSAPVGILAQEAKQLPEIDVVNELYNIQQAKLPKLAQPLIVDGDLVIDGWFVVADEIIFKSGARLVFSQQALDARRNFFIVTKKLTTVDSGNPGTITYVKPAVTGTTGLPGQAATGTHGQNDGDSGGQGQPGAIGAVGLPGFAAPLITLTVLEVPNSGVLIDVGGGLGGIGGQGQKGGDGGNGHQGSPASQSAVDCKAGGGQGGNGGMGGAGGKGGTGGSGGSGGTVKIIAPAELLPSLTEKFRVLVSGGDGGKLGQGGPGGNGGQAGPGGQEAKPFCGGGSGGSGGSPGPNGEKGEDGPKGSDGDFFVGAMSKLQFESIYN